jgi:hypothetical protein
VGVIENQVGGVILVPSVHAQSSQGARSRGRPATEGAVVRETWRPTAKGAVARELARAPTGKAAIRERGQLGRWSRVGYSFLVPLLILCYDFIFY